MESLKFSNFYRNNRRWQLAAIIAANIAAACLIFYFMGIKHRSIGFHIDDYGFIYNGSYQSWHDIKRIFSNGDMICNAGTMHEQVITKPSFLEALYRPLLLITMGTLHKIFGMNTHLFHLTHTLLHTLVSLFLLNFLYFYRTPIIIALPLALFFGFHSSLKDYFFWQCYIQNTLEAVLFLGFITLFFLWQKRRSLLVFTTSLFLFLIILLLRETLIIVPLLIFLWLFMSQVNQRWLHRFAAAAQKTVIFCIPIVAYFIIRLFAHPLTADPQRLGIKHFNTMPEVGWLKFKLLIGDRLTWLIDLIGLKWLPAGTAYLKFAILIFIVGLGIVTWQRSSCKNLILIAAAGIILTSWPSLLLVHCSRYLYLPSLFFVSLIGLLCVSLEKKTAVIVGFIFSIYAGLQAYVTTTSVSDWATRTGEEQRIIKEIAQLSTTLAPNEQLCILTYPTRLFGTGSIMGINLHACKNLGHIHFLAPYYTRWEDGPTGNINTTQIDKNTLVSIQQQSTTWFDPQALQANFIGNFKILDQHKNKAYSFIFSPSINSIKIYVPQINFSTSNDHSKDKE